MERWNSWRPEAGIEALATKGSPACLPRRRTSSSEPFRLQVVFDPPQDSRLSKGRSGYQDAQSGNPLPPHASRKPPHTRRTPVAYPPHASPTSGVPKRQALFGCLYLRRPLEDPSTKMSDFNAEEARARPPRSEGPRGLVDPALLRRAGKHNGLTRPVGRGRQGRPRRRCEATGPALGHRSPAGAAKGP